MNGQEAVTMKYHIEKNSIEETLVIPLYGRKVCSEKFPDLFKDTEAARICDMLDYDFETNGKKMESTAGMFGALEVAQRQYDLMHEVKAYLGQHPKAAVVNLGCGLDNTFRQVDNGECRGYNIDMADVIAVRDKILPTGEREENIASDINDHSWMERIDAENGAVFFAAGVFYYLKTEDMKKLFAAMAENFPGGVLVFDCCGIRGAKLMRKTWLKEAGITDVNAYFSLEGDIDLLNMVGRGTKVTSKSYMSGYRDIREKVGFVHRILIGLSDSVFKMRIYRTVFPRRKKGIY